VESAVSAKKRLSQIAADYAESSQIKEVIFLVPWCLGGNPTLQKSSRRLPQITQRSSQIKEVIFLVPLCLGGNPTLQEKFTADQSKI
jgi:hypothetical protein